MSKDTGELIKKKSINLCCQPIFSYISSLIIVPNALFSQSLSHILKENLILYMLVLKMSTRDLFKESCAIFCEGTLPWATAPLIIGE